MHSLGGGLIMPRLMANGGNGRYQTPPASELQRLLWVKPGASGHLDEVRPGIYIGDMYAAKDKHLLQSLNITYVLNAAHGKFSVNTGASFYRDTKISYHGVEAFDMPSFDLSPFFYSAAKFIKTAMSTPGDTVMILSFHPDLKTHRLVPEDDVNVRHDLHQRLFEELADEGRREVQTEDLVVVRCVFGHFEDGLRRHGQEKALQDRDQDSE
uniref:Dual specificity protein phosphatase n=1 Tax=Cyprinus carpio TaxID=7962 RepID=A0A8C2A2K6_CYPCA